MSNWLVSRCEVPSGGSTHNSFQIHLRQRQTRHGHVRQRFSYRRNSNTFETRFDPPERNRLLRLAMDLDEQLAPELESVHLQSGQVLRDLDERARYLYFPRDAVFALVVVRNDGKAIEGGCIGNEGMVGVEAILGNAAPPEEIVVVVSGRAARMQAAVFAEIMQGNLKLRTAVQDYMLALMYQLARTATCNLLHSAMERCVRWLLMCTDRVGRDSLLLTSDSLVQLLGARTAAVTDALDLLMRNGVIRYQCGQLTILNREQLEDSACEDYRLCRDSYDRVYA